MKLGELGRRLRGFSTPIGGLSWNPPPNERDAVNRLMVYFADRRVLYVPSEAESPPHVVTSVQEIRRALSETAEQFVAGSELELKLRAMRSACVHFLNRVGKNEEITTFGGQIGHWANWEFTDSLGQWRALMAVYIAMLSSSYNVEAPSFIGEMLPQILERRGEEASSWNLRQLDYVEQFEALTPAQRRAEVDGANAYLASEEGQRELSMERSTRNHPSGKRS